MIRPDTAKWNQVPDDLRQLAINAEHPRTRERFLALYQIAAGQTNATQWAEQTDRCDECVLGWVHRYNEEGPEAMTYRRTGGSAPFLRRRKPSRFSTPSKRRFPKSTACPATAGP